MLSRKMRVSTFLVVISMCAMAMVSAAPQRADSPISAREFARDLANAARAANVQRVVRQLQAIDLGKDPDAALTEQGAVTMLQSLGVFASSANPDHPVTKEKSKSLVRYVMAWSPPSGPIGQALSGRSDVPATVDECFNEKNHGACVDCCKEMGGGASSCAKACFVINKPSASEPLP